MKKISIKRIVSLCLALTISAILPAVTYAQAEIMLDENYVITGNPLEGWTPVTQTEADIINNLDGNNKPVSNYAFLPVIKNVNGNMMLNFPFSWKPMRTSAFKLLAEPSYQRYVSVGLDVSCDNSLFKAALLLLDSNGNIASEVMLGDSDGNYKYGVKVMDPGSGNDSGTGSRTQESINGFTWQGNANKVFRIEVLLDMEEKTQTVSIKNYNGDLIAQMKNAPLYDAAAVDINKIIISNIYTYNSSASAQGNLYIDNFQVKQSETIENTGDEDFEDEFDMSLVDGNRLDILYEDFSSEESIDGWEQVDSTLLRARYGITTGSADDCSYMPEVVDGELNFAFCWNPRRRPSAVKRLESPVKGIVNVEFDVKTTVESFFAPVEIRSNDNRILSKIILNETDTTYKDCIKVISPLSDTKTHPGLDGFSWKGYGNKTIRIRAVLNSNTKTQSVYVIDAQTNELLAYTENVPFFESSGSCAVGEILISDLYMNGSGSTWSGNLMIDNLHIYKTKYDVSLPEIKKADGTELIQLIPGDTIMSSAKVQTDKDVINTAVLYTALFKSDGALEKLVACDDGSLRTEIQLPDDVKGKYVKSMIWFGMEPLAGAKKFGGEKLLKLSNLFTENMVLQRDKVHTIWGKGTIGEPVEVRIYNDSESTSGTAVVDDNADWSVDLPPLPAGGPYTLEAVCDGEMVEVGQIYVGDVFVLAGQSNMEVTYNKSIAHGHSATDIPPAVVDDNIKHFTMRTVGASEPAYDVPYRDENEQWMTLSEENNKDISTIGVYFAKALLENEPDVPIGLISVAWGGTTIGRWMREGTADIYNTHIAPILKYNIAAILWYQGESNQYDSTAYMQNFPKLIDDYRKQWGEEDLPFYYVQLARYTGNDFTQIRDVQLRTLKSVENPVNIGMVVTLDTDKNTYENIHPLGKDIIGQRLALFYERDILGKDIICSGPIYKSAVIEDNCIRVEFEADSVGEGLEIIDVYGNDSKNQLKEFEIAGDDGVFVAANAVIDGNDVVVSSPEVENPKYVRYAWSKVPENPNLFNKSGLPASPFNTINY